MKTFLILTLVLLFTGCTTSGAKSFDSLMNQLSFDADESGTVRITGEVNVGIPVIGTKVHVDYAKTKEAVVSNEP